MTDVCDLADVLRWQDEAPAPEPPEPDPAPMQPIGRVANAALRSLFLRWSGDRPERRA